MKVRISFTCDDIVIDVPQNTNMQQYLIDNAWDLVKQLIDEPASILPTDWDTADEDEEKEQGANTQ